MKHLILFSSLLLLCALTGFSQDLSTSTSQTTTDLVMKYYTVEPNIVYNMDENTLITLEVVTTGETINQIRMDKPVTGNLYDDGSHGDRTAGDGIYSLNNIPHNLKHYALGHGGTHNVRGHFHIIIEKTDGSTEEHYLQIGYVDSEQHFPTVKLGDGLYATDYAFFIVDTAGTTLEITDWPLGYIQCGKAYFAATQKFYSVLPDIFDFITIMPANTIYNPDNFSENVPYFVRAKNEIQHIGVDLFDNTAQFGSAGQLRGMIYHSWGTGQILDHEIGHCWCADIGQSLNLCRTENSHGNHWNPYSDIGGQMSAFLSHPDCIGHLKSNGDGTWRIERDPGDYELYSMLDLYVMGLIPPQEVPPAHILINPDLTDYQHVTADQVDTCTIEEIMAAEGGERIPSYVDSPKEFNTAFIVVKNKEFTPADFAYYSLVSKYFASEEQGELSLTTYYTATGGRGRLNPRLPVETSVHQHEYTIKHYELKQNYPNPFNPSTCISYNLPKSTHVTLKIYNIQGQLIRTLIDGSQIAGAKTILWNGMDEHGIKASSGIYIYQITTPEFRTSKKMMLIQ